MDEINATVSEWNQYAEQAKVNAPLREAIADTLIHIS
jgi:hypothetical protein